MPVIDTIKVGNMFQVVDVTVSPSLTQYSAGELLADTQLVSGAFRNNGGSGSIKTLTVVDGDDQKAAFDIYIHTGSTTMGTENDAVAPSDASGLNLCAKIAVVANDYTDLGGVSVAFFRGFDIPVHAASTVDGFYFSIVNGAGTPTYTASGLKLRFGMEQS